MPCYEYLENGRVVDRVLPVARRDDFPGRITVPRRLHVCPRGAPTAENELMTGWKDCEESMGTEGVRKMAKGLGLTREQVKQVLAQPD